MICRETARAQAPCVLIGKTRREKTISIRIDGVEVLAEDMRLLRGWWEETRHRLERLQVNPACADEERESIYDRPGPTYSIPFTPSVTPSAFMESALESDSGCPGDSAARRGGGKGGPPGGRTEGSTTGVRIDRTPQRSTCTKPKLAILRDEGSNSDREIPPRSTPRASSPGTSP